MSLHTAVNYTDKSKYSTSVLVQR